MATKPGQFWATQPTPSEERHQERPGKQREPEAAAQAHWAQEPAQAWEPAREREPKAVVLERRRQQRMTLQDARWAEVEP